MKPVKNGYKVIRKVGNETFVTICESLEKARFLSRGLGKIVPCKYVEYEKDGWLVKEEITTEEEA